MTARYILLSPLVPEFFGITSHEELLEAVTEFGCDLLLSHFPNGDYVAFAVSTTKDALTNMCATVDLPGIVLEYTSVYDQAEILI
jgi:hypothetical protein